MKKVLFLLVFLSNLSFACDDHPTSASKSPLWVQYLVQAASKKGHDHSNTKKKHESQPKTKKATPKKDK